MRLPQVRLCGDQLVLMLRMMCGHRRASKLARGRGRGRGRCKGRGRGRGRSGRRWRLEGGRR